MGSVALLSGGIESAAITAIFKPELAVTIDYGQRASEKEILTSNSVSNLFGCKHIVMKADISTATNSLLFGDYQNDDYVAFRNQLLITMGAMAAKKFGHSKIYIGTVRTDNRFPDGSPEFIHLINSLISAQEPSITVCAPGLDLTTHDLIKWSEQNEEFFRNTHSCHTGNIHCGDCPGCYKRAAVLKEVFGP